MLLRPSSWLRRAYQLGLVAAIVFSGIHAWAAVLALLKYPAYRSNFALYYVFSEMGLRYGWSRLYDLEIQRRVTDSVGPIWLFPMNFTPPLAWIVAPITLLPLPAAYWVWGALTAAAFLTTWWLASPVDPLPKILCLVAVFPIPAVFLAFAMGNVVLVQLALLAVGYRLMNGDKQVAGGLALGMTAIHPQGFFLLPLALLAGRRLQAALACIGCQAGLVAASVVALRRSGLRAYLDRLELARSHPLQFAEDDRLNLWVVLAGHRLLLAAAVTAVVGALLVVAWRHRDGALEVVLAAGLIGSVITAPFIHLDDTLSLVMAGWLVARTRPPALQTALLIAGLVLIWQVASPGPINTVLLIFEALWLLSLIALPRRPPFDLARSSAGASEVECSVSAGGRPAASPGRPAGRSSSTRDR